MKMNKSPPPPIPVMSSLLTLVCDVSSFLLAAVNNGADNTYEQLFMISL